MPSSKKLNPSDYAEALTEYGLSALTGSTTGPLFGAINALISPGDRMNAFSRGLEQGTYRPQGAAAQQFNEFIMESPLGEYATENPEQMAWLSTITPAGVKGVLPREVFRPAKNKQEKEAEITAKGLRELGVPDEEIWRRTGWAEMPGTDMWVKEISDDQMRLSGRPAPAPGYAYDLEFMFSHPELYKDTPEMRGVEYATGDYPRGAGYRRSGRQISMGNEVRNPTDLLNFTTHELQHALQHRYGMPGGSDPDKFGYSKFGQDMDKVSSALSLYSPRLSARQLESIQDKGIPLSGALPNLNESELTMVSNLLRDWGQFQDKQNIAMRKYNDTQGEAMARLAAERRKLTPEQRTSLYPFDEERFEKLTGSRIMDLWDPMDSWLPVYRGAWDLESLDDPNKRWFFEDPATAETFATSYFLRDPNMAQVRFGGSAPQPPFSGRKMSLDGLIEALRDKK